MPLIPENVWLEAVVNAVAHRSYVDHNGEAGSDAHVGSTAMCDALKRVRPRLVVCGHIHLVDNDYRQVNPAVRITL